MNDDYLWDKTGQPDPQIQQLEEILGSLRYQPKPLHIPADLSAHRRRRHLPGLAIAATILVALLATGLWLRVTTEKDPQPQQANVPIPPATVEDKQTAPRAEKSSTSSSKQTIAVNNNRRKRSSAPVLGKREREEALAAKEQLLLALRLASEKLNLAHRKTQSTSPANQIKNQHRVG